MNDDAYYSTSKFAVVIETQDTMIEVVADSPNGSIEHIKDYVPLLNKLVKERNLLLCTFDWFGDRDYIIQSFLTEDPQLVYNFYLMMNGKAGMMKETTHSIVYKITAVADYKIATDFIYSLYQEEDNQNTFIKKAGLSRINLN